MKQISQYHIGNSIHAETVLFGEHQFYLFDLRLRLRVLELFDTSYVELVPDVLVELEKLLIVQFVVHHPVFLCGTSELLYIFFQPIVLRRLGFYEVLEVLHLLLVVLLVSLQFLAVNLLLSI